MHLQLEFSSGTSMVECDRSGLFPSASASLTIFGISDVQRVHGGRLRRVGEFTSVSRMSSVAPLARLQLLLLMFRCPFDCSPLPLWFPYVLQLLLTGWHLANQEIRSRTGRTSFFLFLVVSVCVSFFLSPFLFGILLLERAFC